MVGGVATTLTFSSLISFEYQRYPRFPDGGVAFTFKGTNTIYTREYLVKIEEGEFNYSLNHTLRGFTSGTTLHTDSPGLLPQFDPTHISGSDFSPYITQILFFEKKPKPFSQTDEPIMVANLPRPLQVSKDVSYTIKVRIDI